MNKLNFLDFCFLLFYCLLSQQILAKPNTKSLSDEKKIKIACVGDSITYGAGIHNRPYFNYPAQLQRLLGEKYQVKNFGVNGRTALEKNKLSYTKTDAYRQSKSFNPDIVFIKLGTNDGKDKYLDIIANFYRDYKTLVESYKALPSKPRVILILPVPVFSDKFKAVETKVIPMIRKVAYQTQTEIINLNTPFLDLNQERYFQDKIHPSVFGLERIALIIYDYFNDRKNFF